MAKINAAKKKMFGLKNEYYHYRKKVNSEHPFSGSDVVLFRSQKQSREVIKEDIGWYEAKLKR